MENLGEIGGKLKTRYTQDITIGQGLLLDRVIRLGALIFAEPIDSSNLSELGLRSQLPDPDRSPPQPPRPRPPQTERPEKTGQKSFPALVNHEVGYGSRLRLRIHQEEAWRAIRGWIASQKEKAEGAERVSPEYLQATVVMPVGGGKTRVMVAGFAAAIEEGIFEIARGDKLVVINHTDQIHRQNREVLERLGPYFQKRFQRRLRISEYKADQKDLSGDLIVVSLPTVNNGARRSQFSQELKAALGKNGRIAMVGVDEVHHLELGRATGRQSWVELLETLREISPNFFRTGFTATPTGREGRVIYRCEQDLMKAGVTPRTYLIRVPGVDRPAQVV
jgi:hypothetical protein